MFLFVMLPQTQRNAQAKIKTDILRSTGFFFSVFSARSHLRKFQKDLLTPTLVEREGTAEWQSTAELLTPVRMEVMTPGMLLLRRAIGLAVIEKCLLSRGGSARGQQWIFQEQPSPPVCLAVRATCLWTGTQHVIILGSVPLRSMTLGESLTSDYALLREYKTLFRAKFSAFLTPEPCSHFSSVPMSLFWAEFLVTRAKIPRKRPLCADGRANSLNHNHKPLP